MKTPATTATPTEGHLQTLARAERLVTDEPKEAADLARGIVPDGLPAEAKRRLAALWERVGHAAEARRAWVDVARSDPRLSTVRVAEKHLDALVDSSIPSTRICLVTSFTAGPLKSFLAVACAEAGIRAEITSVEYRAIEGAARDPSSALYASRPDLILLAIDLDDAIPDWVLIPFDEAARERSRAAAAGVVDLARTLAATRPEALVAVHTLRVPFASPLGSNDAVAEFGVRPFLRQLNDALVKELRSVSALPVDFDAIVSAVGQHALDPKMMMLSGCPYGDALLDLAARRLRGPLRVRAGRSAKVIVVDLDNTLWGGVLGEVGADGIELGPTAPGSAYLDLQRVLDALERRGMLLAVASKNDEDHARSCIREHPQMLLREDRFAAFKIGWQSKPDSIRQIAEELSLGLSSFVFVDDNPVERARMRAELPEVTTIEMPAEPARYASALLECDVLDVLEVTKEDKNRTKTYVARRLVDDLRKKAETPEQFFESLSLVATIAALKPSSVSRVAQLFQKTNQWNLTLARYDAPEVQTWMGDPAHRVYTLRLQDRFADHGLVSVAVVDGSSPTWTIQNMVMSCRVIGMAAETTLLATMIADAQAAGATRFSGKLVYAPRNEPARDFFERHGFTLVERDVNGESWTLDLAAGTVPAPAFVRIERDS